jgi:hypothetical protein
LNGSLSALRALVYAGSLALLSHPALADARISRNFAATTSLPDEVLLEGAPGGQEYLWRIARHATVTLENVVCLETDAGEAGPVTLQISGGGAIVAMRRIRFGHSAGIAGPGHLVISKGSSVVIEDGFQLAESSGSIDLQDFDSALLLSEHLAITLDEERSVLKFPRRHGGHGDVLPVTINGRPVRLSGEGQNASFVTVVRHGQIFDELKVREGDPPPR